MKAGNQKPPAKEILADSFHELAEDRQIDKITVRETAAARAQEMARPLSR